MTFVLTVAAACCAFASVCGEAVRVYGEAGGVVRMPGVSARFYPHVFNLEWGGGSAQGGLLPGKDGLHRWTLRPNGKANPKIDGTLVCGQAGGRAARLTWTFTPEADMELAEVCVSAAFQYDGLKGGKVVLDGRALALPDEKPARAQLG